VGKKVQPEKTNLRILLVDDDVDFIASMLGILELEDYQVETAGSTAMALEKSEQFKPDVALVDIKLGQEDGFHVVRELKKILPELICITVTAYADTDTAISALKSGVYDYLRKPFEAEALFAVLNRCADRLKLLVEKQAADQAQKESEARFKITFETSPDAIILAYSGGDIVDVNPAFEQLTGHKREQVIGRNSQEIGLWKSPVEREKLLELLASVGQVNNFESQFRMSDGQIRTGLVSARVALFNGEQVGLFAVRDIHELKAKEQAVTESEERFRGLVSHIPGAVYRCLLDADWTMQFISNPINEISGYPARDFINNSVRSYASIIHPDDSALVTQAITLATSQKRPFSIEYRIIHADGSICWVHSKGQSVFGLNGAVNFLDGAIFDITENKKAMAELEQSEARFRALSQEHSAVLEGIPDAILLIDLDLNVIWGNSGASLSFEIPKNELVGKSCESIWQCDAEQCQGCLRRVINEKVPLEAIQKTPDGRTWGVKAFPVKNAAGKVLNVIQIASDMTEKMRLRDQASRSSHLAALGELAAGVAHEINNPTGTILLDMPMLRDVFTDLCPILEKYEAELKNMKIAGLPFARICQEIPIVIEEVQEGAQRIKKIVDELKDFSRPASGERDDIDLNDIARKAVSLVRNPLKQATDNFSEKYCEKPLLCVGNAQRLEQVVVNLLLNACQSLPEREHGIHVETCMDKDADYVRILIRDEGVGVAEETLTQITDPFFTTRREVGGTGLGLSVSSRIIDEHKGSLTFASEPGVGTTVTVDLPLAGKVSDDE